MEKNITINNQIIKFKIIDKKLRNTIVCIHGFYSNEDFIGELDNHIDNFNIISFNYGDIEKISSNEIQILINKIFKKHLKHTKIFILAHSLGGLFASEVAKLKKVKGVYLVNPIHPYLWQSKTFAILKKMINPKTQIGKSSIKLIIKTLKMNNSPLLKFIDYESSWFQILVDLIDVELNLEKIIDKNYQEIKNKTMFLVSKKDNIISSSKLIEYLENNNYKYHLLDYSGHSPLFDKSEIVAPFLLNIKSKKRWFFKNIIR